MKFIEDICLAYVNNTNIYGYSARAILNNTSIYIVPTGNPDGVNLVTGQIKPGSKIYNQARQIAQSFPSIPFPSRMESKYKRYRFKPSISSSDGNRQKGLNLHKDLQNQRLVILLESGPLTAPESLALYNFTLFHNFRLIITYHTQGKEIYWQFQNYATEEAREIGELFANISGYNLANVPFESGFAGYKDWFLQQYRRPGYTIEAGIGRSPLPISQFSEIYNDNLGIIVLGSLV